MPTEKPDVSLEEQKKSSQETLEWEQTFDAVSDPIFIIDTEHTIIRANRAMAERCGLAPFDLVGRKCFEVMHGTDSVPEECPHARLMRDGKPQKAEFAVEKLHGIFEVTMSPVLNGEGKVTANVHVARDVTEKRHQEELLLAQQRQLEEINSSLESRIENAVAELRKKDDIIIQQSRLTAMGEMISNIAHQWRQPLNNIGLIVQGLQLAYKANDLTAEELDEDIAEAMKVLQQISETIDDFRTFFSLEVEAKSFVVNELVARALSFVGPSLRRQGIRVELVEEPEVTANGYPNEYVQAILNIILNARDVLLELQVAEPEVTIRIFRESGRSVVTILDNGGGVPEENLPKIFDPYFTTKKQGAGSGIGLYMSKMIVEKKMQGCLTVRNVDGGAEFRIEI